MSTLTAVTLSLKGPPGPGLGGHVGSRFTHVTKCTSTTRPEEPTAGQVIYETDTDLYRYWDGDSWPRLIPDPSEEEEGPGPGGAFSGELLVLLETTDQVITESGSALPVLFDSIHHDPHGLRSNTTNPATGPDFAVSGWPHTIITLPAGRYGIEYNVAWDTNTNGRRSLFLWSNLSRITPEGSSRSTSSLNVGGTRHSMRAVVSVAGAGDELVAWVWQNSGNARSIGSRDDGDVPGRTTLAVTYLGPN